MARKKANSPLEDMVLATSKLPWWAGLSLALISFVVLHGMAASPLAPVAAGPGALGAVATGGIIKGLAIIGQYVAPFIFGIAALISFVNEKKQQKLYETTVARSGVASLLDMSWHQFEQLIDEHYRRQGFQVTRKGGSGPDGGVDLVLRRDGEMFFVQCKQWKRLKVPVQTVRELYGVMAARGATGGYVVSAGEFTADAQEFASGRGVVLVDGRQLRAMLDTVRSPAATVAPAPATAVEQPACPKCSAAMTQRTARQGANAGQSFWGCSTYPACKGTRPLADQLPILS